MALPRSLALAGIAAIVVAVGMIGSLHVTGPSAELDPMRRTISQYALLETGHVFNTAVVVLALGSAATLLALVRTEIVPVRSMAALALLLWCVGLAAVVYFPKHNWAVGPSVEGTIHRYASVVAFLSLPVAALLVGRRWWRDPRWRTQARVSTALGLVALLCFAPIAVAFVLYPFTGVPWWRAIPLGGVERLLAFVEVVAVVQLALWAIRAGSRGASAGAVRAGSRGGGAVRTGSRSGGAVRTGTRDSRNRAAS
ncbi:DUF998 domain-containing protein [Virgisporangium ochraceum]|uniref:DUF998 domain-containing protein n=1 Tax=Virgisporangium ochraceum TaxID=65505 RepID=A0A8J3ZPB9_9ACTN|nr:DUF998 domain-containing protein [Virgisporangium ochraceum]GIJ67366.1 hypothetical protein Voc01_022830 [Virgisporangium ochraceum]